MSLILAILPLLIHTIAYGQAPNSDQIQNLTNQKLDQIFKQRIGSNYTQTLLVDYVSPSTIVFSATSGAILNSPTDFWKAIDILKNDYNFSLDKLIINGAGSSSNPEIFYAVMFKQK